MCLGVQWGSVLRMPLQRPCFPGIARLFPRSLVSSEPGIPFWPLCHAFRRSGMRKYKPPPFFRTSTWECSGARLHACHSGARQFPELHVYSRGPKGLANVGFHFGRFVMRLVEVECVSARLLPSFALVSGSAVGLGLTHATTTLVIFRSCASIPEVPRF